MENTSVLTASAGIDRLQLGMNRPVLMFEQDATVPNEIPLPDLRRLVADRGRARKLWVLIAIPRPPGRGGLLALLGVYIWLRRGLPSSTGGAPHRPPIISHGLGGDGGLIGEFYRAPPWFLPAHSSG
jgi:hypothetical protein